MSFNKKLQEIRKNNDLSQEKLAEILNVSRQSVSKWERGQGYPEIDKLIFISERFNVSLDELLKDTYTRQRKPISLKKEKPVQEIYPSAIPAVVTSPDNNLSAYNTNLRNSNVNVVPPAGKCRSKRRISRKRIILSCLLPFTVMIPVGMAVGISAHNNRNAYSYTDESTYEDYDEYDNYGYEDEDYTYTVNRLYDEDTNTYYIFDGDFGIVSYLYTEEMDQYVKLYDSDSNTYKYCYKSYAEENPVFKYNNTTYIIPDYILASSIDAEDSDEYTLMYDTTQKAYFVPNYVLTEDKIKTNESAGSSDEAIEDEKNDNNSDAVNDADAINEH